jgi:hypothetical protein
MLDSIDIMFQNTDTECFRIKLLKAVVNILNCIVKQYNILPMIASRIICFGHIFANIFQHPLNALRIKCQAQMARIGNERERASLLH